MSERPVRRRQEMSRREREAAFAKAAARMPHHTGEKCDLLRIGRDETIERINKGRQIRIEKHYDTRTLREGPLTLHGLAKKEGTPVLVAEHKNIEGQTAPEVVMRGTKMEIDRVMRWGDDTRVRERQVQRNVELSGREFTNCEMTDASRVVLRFNDEQAAITFQQENATLVNGYGLGIAISLRSEGARVIIEGDQETMATYYKFLLRYLKIAQGRDFEATSQGVSYQRELTQSEITARETTPAEAEHAVEFGKPEAQPKEAQPKEAQPAGVIFVDVQTTETPTARAITPRSGDPKMVPETESSVAPEVDIFLRSIEILRGALYAATAQEADCIVLTGIKPGKLTGALPRGITHSSAQRGNGAGKVAILEGSNEALQAFMSQARGVTLTIQGTQCEVRYAKHGRWRTSVPTAADIEGPLILRDGLTEREYQIGEDAAQKHLKELAKASAPKETARKASFDAGVRAIEAFRRKCAPIHNSADAVANLSATAGKQQQTEGEVIVQPQYPYNEESINFGPKGIGVILNLGSIQAVEDFMAVASTEDNPSDKVKVKKHQRCVAIFMTERTEGEDVTAIEGYTKLLIQAYLVIQPDAQIKIFPIEKQKNMVPILAEMVRNERETAGKLNVGVELAMVDERINLGPDKFGDNRIGVIIKFDSEENARLFHEICNRRDGCPEKAKIVLEENCVAVYGAKEANESDFIEIIAEFLRRRITIYMGEQYGYGKASDGSIYYLSEVPDPAIKLIEQLQASPLYHTNVRVGEPQAYTEEVQFSDGQIGVLIDFGSKQGKDNFFEANGHYGGYGKIKFTRGANTTFALDTPTGVAIFIPEECSHFDINRVEAIHNLKIDIQQKMQAWRNRNQMLRTIPTEQITIRGIFNKKAPEPETTTAPAEQDIPTTKIDERPLEARRPYYKYEALVTQFNLPRDLRIAHSEGPIPYSSEILIGTQHLEAVVLTFESKEARSKFEGIARESCGFPYEIRANGNSLAFYVEIYNKRLIRSGSKQPLSEKVNDTMESGEYYEKADRSKIQMTLLISSPQQLR